MNTLLLSPLLAYALTLLFIPVACRAALVTGYMDMPGGRKKHRHAVPPVGGIVIFAIYIALSLVMGLTCQADAAYYTALALLLLTGFIDDRWEVRAIIKFYVHITAATIIVMWGHAKLVGLGMLFGPVPFELGPFATIFTILCIIHLINAINFIDGVDGLSGCMAVIILGTLMAYCLHDGMIQTFYSMAILLACFIGFLFYNMRHPLNDRARVFLGDAGSTALGLTIAWFSINITNSPNASISPIFIAWLVGLPIIDAFCLFVTRMVEGSHPFDADRRHFHHHFQRAGFTPGQTCVAITLYAALLALIGFTGTYYFEDYIMGWAWLVLLGMHMAITMMPNRFIALLKRLKA